MDGPGSSRQSASRTSASGSSRPSRTRRSLTNFNRRLKAFLLRAQGFSGRSARRWVDKVARSKREDEGFTRAQKRRAYRWGFLPVEVENFGITEENRSQIVSERDYLYLHPINGTYDKWVRDRISTLNVFSRFSDAFEPCCYHVIRRAGEPFLIPLSGEAKGCPPDLDGLHAFLTGHGPVTVSSTVWKSRRRWSLGAGVDVEGRPCFILDGLELSPDELWDWFDLVTRKRSLAIFDAATGTTAVSPLAPGAEAVLHVYMLDSDPMAPQACQAFLELVYVSEGNPAGNGRGDEDDADLLERDPEDGADEEDWTAKAAELDVTQKVLRLARKSTPESRSCYAPVDGAGRFQGLRAEGGDGRLVLLDRAPGSDLPFEGSVPGWDEALMLLKAMLRTVPQIEFIDFELHVEDAGLVIVGASPAPPYNPVLPFSSETSSFLLARAAIKHDSWSKASTRAKRFLHNTRLKIRRTWNSLAAPKGLVPYQSTRWPHDVWCDLVSSNGLDLKTKLWAHRHGFLSYRIPQYGITEDNWTQFISDFEYRWLRHLNNKYKYWLEDKITFKYVASGYREYLPDYYYYICFRNGQHRIVPMMDLPEGFGATAEDILRLACEKGVLALKPDEGSHGEGFYRLAWENGTFTLNGEPADESRVLGILEDPANQYLVTEYVQMHHAIKEIYPGSVNTVRFIVFKRDGRAPQIGAAYLRIGTSATGGVDNLAAGGIAAEVDVGTGRFGNALILDGVNQGNLVPCPVHPDTKVPIEGVMPRWEETRELVLDIARSIPQLEYFGFDVAITEDGIKVIEINRSPDYPRIVKLSPEANEYFLYRLARKKHIYGYDVEPCHKLLGLPER